MIIEGTLIQCDVRHKSGRIYPKSIMKNIETQINTNDKKILITTSQTPTELKELDYLGYVKNASFDENTNKLNVKIECCSKTLMMLCKDDPIEFNRLFSVVPNGVGTVDMSGKISEDYKLISCSVVPKQDVI